VPPKTPAPPTKAPAAEKPAEKAVAQKGGDKPGSEDDIAAMLLLLQDEGDTSGGSSSDVVPEGSTVFDVPAIAGTQPDGTPVAGKDKAKDAKKNENTSDAAKAILEKYMRRPRG
jgi:hypothetical protein